MYFKHNRMSSTNITSYLFYIKVDMLCMYVRMYVCTYVCVYVCVCVYVLCWYLI